MVRAGGRIGHPGRNREPQDPRPVGYSPEPFLGSPLRRWAQVSACPLNCPSQASAPSSLIQTLEAAACEAVCAGEVVRW
jgi:hypothetical protein